MLVLDSQRQIFFVKNNDLYFGATLSPSRRRFYLSKFQIPPFGDFQIFTQLVPDSLLSGFQPLLNGFQIFPVSGLQIPVHWVPNSASWRFPLRGNSTNRYCRHDQTGFFLTTVVIINDIVVIDITQAFL